MLKLSEYHFLLLLFTMLTCLPILSKEQSINDISFSRIDKNVPYSEVAKLAWQAPHETIQYGDNSEQFIQVWHGAKSASVGKYKHAVVFIHGGCWLKDYTIEHSYALTSGISQQGYTTYSIEYRRTGNGGEWPVALQDLELAFAHIKTLLPPHTRITITGHSAGGHLAALLAAQQSDEDYPVHLIGLAPIIDLPAYSKGDNSCQSATAQFMLGTAEQQVKAYQQANPLNNSFDTLDSATLMIGNADKIVPLDMATHPQAQLLVIEGVGHFDWIHPGSEAFKQFIAVIKENE